MRGRCCAACLPTVWESGRKAHNTTTCTVPLLLSLTSACTCCMVARMSRGSSRLLSQASCSVNTRGARSSASVTGARRLQPPTSVSQLFCVLSSIARRMPPMVRGTSCPRRRSSALRAACCRSAVAATLKKYWV